MKRKAKKSNTGKASDLFGISEKKAQELFNEFKHAQIDADHNMKKLAEIYGVANTGEIGYKLYVFTRMLAENERFESVSQKIKEIMLSEVE